MAKTKGAAKKAEKKPAKADKPAKAVTAAKAPAKAAPTAKVAPPKKAAPTAKAAPTKKAEPPKPKLPAVAVKPKKASAPSIPLPPPPPPPPAHRDELNAPRDVARLLRYGEQFGPHRIDVRMLPVQIPAPSGALALMDPLVPKSYRVFDRPVVAGTFRVMLSVAKTSDKGGNKERLAAVVIHVGRPPIAKWTVAHYRGQKKPKSPDDLPRVDVSGEFAVLIDAGKGTPGTVGVPGAPASIAPVEIPMTDGGRALALASGDGAFAAYWGVDAEDKAVCLVLDFDVFTQKDWKAKPTA